MSEITVRANNFHRLLDYLQRVNIDVPDLMQELGLNLARINALPPEQTLPAQRYALIYRTAVKQLERAGDPLPWGAGMGSEAFELMCHTLITGRTLEEALQTAARFEKLTFVQMNYCMSLSTCDANTAKLSYRIDLSPERHALIPGDWDRFESGLTVARASGLLVWKSLCGWVTGQPISARELRLAGPRVSDEYHQRLKLVFNCPVHYDAPENCFLFDAEALERRVVQTPESLKGFLDNCVYELIAQDQAPASTSSAIRSLLRIDLTQGMPAITDMASLLHLSESSLRRRLRSENTSYQALKDEVRCEVAVEKLLNEQAKVADLAELLGFAEPSSFVRSFKSWTGQTPRDYRQSMRTLGAA